MALVGRVKGRSISAFSSSFLPAIHSQGEGRLTREPLK